MKAKFEAISLLPANSFKAFLEDKTSFDAPWHFHPEYELTFIVNSNGIRYVGNHMENFEPYDFALLGPGLPHCWKNTGDQNGNAQSIVIQWTEEMLGQGWLESREFLDVKKLFTRAANGVKFDKEVARKFSADLFLLLELPPFEKLMKLLELLNALAQTSRYHILCRHGFSIESNLEYSERINLVYQFVKNNYMDKITLADVSKEVNMSAENFSRFFSRVMKKPFFSFLNEYRLNMACKLLIETDMEVKQISYACGYGTLPFFYRQFSKFKLLSPLEFKFKYQHLDQTPNKNFS